MTVVLQNIKILSFVSVVVLYENHVILYDTVQYENVTEKLLDSDIFGVVQRLSIIGDVPVKG